MDFPRFLKDMWYSMDGFEEEEMKRFVVEKLSEQNYWIFENVTALQTAVQEGEIPGVILGAKTEGHLPDHGEGSSASRSW
jgi:hypothetical protein